MLFNRMCAAWTAGSAEDYGAGFTPDCDYISFGYLAPAAVQPWPSLRPTGRQTLPFEHGATLASSVGK